MAKGLIMAESRCGPDEAFAILSRTSMGRNVKLHTIAAEMVELIEKLLKTLIEGLAIFKTQKDKSIAVMRKNLRGVNDEILEETYQSSVGEMEQVPLPTLAVIKSGLDILALQYSQAKQTDPAPIFPGHAIKPANFPGLFS